MELLSPQAALEIVRLINDGTESALNVEVELSAQESVKADMVVPARIPFIVPQAAGEMNICFVKELATPHFTHGKPLKEFLRTDIEEMPMAVRFENARGTKFRRSFRLRRELQFGGVHCFPQRREILNPEK